MKKRKKASTINKFVWRKGEKYQFFVWDEKIHNAFMILLIFTVLILAGLTYAQNLYIKQLELRSFEPNFSVVKPEIIPIEVFASENDIPSIGMGDLSAYFLKEGFELYLGVGVFEATKKECASDVCVVTTYRFNQRKGYYLDKFEEIVEN